MHARIPILTLCVAAVITGCPRHRPPQLDADDDSAVNPGDDDSATPPVDDDDTGGTVETELYGCAWNADDLDNLPLGTEVGRRVSYRFRAHHAGPVDAVWAYLIFHGPGYFDGDGGQVLVELTEDDGSPQHLPAATVLASSLVTDPMVQWNRRFVFDAPADLQQGQLYHLVFSNPAPDPVNDYVSLDGLHVAANSPGVQPPVSDTDLGTLYRRHETDDWELLYQVTPIFSLEYDGWPAQGQCYIDVRDEFDFIHVQGDVAVREVFTVSAHDRVVSSVRIRLQRTQGEGELSVRFERDGGPLLEALAVPAASVGAGVDWLEVPFGAEHTLEAGATYHLELYSPAGTTYTVPPLQDGIFYGLDCDNLFADGHFQAREDGVWGMIDDRTDFEMQFYFPVESDR
jgi:hypothetical protein